MAMPPLPMARVVLEIKALGSRSVKSTLSASSLRAVRQRQLKVVTSMCQLDPLTQGVNLATTRSDRLASCDQHRPHGSEGM